MGKTRPRVSRAKGRAKLRGRRVPVRTLTTPTLAEALADRLIADIQAGYWPLGEPLPSRPAIVARYADVTFTLTTLREALEIVTYRGYLSMGTDYVHAHRRVVTRPFRYPAVRSPGPEDPPPEPVRPVIDAPLADGDPEHAPLQWEPVVFASVPVPDDLAADFGAGRPAHGVSLRLLHFVDRLWAGHEVVAVHLTWVWPYPELLPHIITRGADTPTPVTLRDLGGLLPVATLKDEVTLVLADPPQRGWFLLTPGWAHPFPLLTVARRAYARDATLVYYQSSWYRPDRFRLIYQQPGTATPTTVLPTP